jgi:valyl-tRNA synthetase
MIGVLTLQATDQRQRPRKVPGPGPLRGPQGHRGRPGSLGALVETKKHKLMVPICTRTGQVVEPMLTDQWFVAMNKVSEGD